MSSAAKIKLNSFDDLFGTGTGESDIREIPLSELHDFKNHPFKKQDDEKINEMADSIRQHGVIVPGICRMRTGGGYEIIAGHTRKQASEIAGLSTMPMVVKNLSDDEAIIAMVDSNIQRETVYPSERAKAFKMRYDAMKRQGAKGNSLQVMSEETGENAKKLQRYIWLARLNDELLLLIDTKKLGMAQGIDLSFLTDEEQKWVFEAMESMEVIPSMEQSAEIKNLSQKSTLEEKVVYQILSPKTAHAKKRKITLKSDRLDDYFEDHYTEAEIEKIIIDLLERWRNEGQ